MNGRFDYLVWKQQTHTFSLKKVENTIISTKDIIY